MNYYINGKKLYSMPEAHEYLKEKLSFPDYYGNNLDALWDCLSEFSGKPEVILYNAEAAKAFLGADFEKLISVFKDAEKEGYLTFSEKGAPLKIVTWNVNGLRACITKGFTEYFNESGADIFCIQETKLQPEQIDFNSGGYSQFWNSAEKKGYSGTACFSRKEPVSVRYGFGTDKHNDEGRAVTLEYEKFYLVNVYVPNSQEGLKRIGYRLEWEEDLKNYLMKLDEKKPVILCGDLNVAHEEIDLKNPKTNRGNAGFSDEEREALGKLLESGFKDAFRELYPELAGAYSWWSYRFRAREKNAGWRIDYFVLSKRISPADVIIRSDIMGSDHCPVELEIFL